MQFLLLHVVQHVRETKILLTNCPTFDLLNELGARISTQLANVLHNQRGNFSKIIIRYKTHCL